MNKALLAMPFVIATAVLGVLMASMGTALAAPAVSDVVNVVDGTERFTLNLEEEVLAATRGL